MNEDRNEESRWFCQIDEREFGPLTMQHLKEMVHSGTLTDQHQVRKDGGIWVPAGRVRGLNSEFRAVPAAPPDTVAEDVEAEHRTKTSEKNSRKSVPKKALVVLATLVIAAAAAISGWISSTDQTFPHPVKIADRTPQHPREAARINAVRAPIPNSPSIRGIRLMRALPIPGLEEIEVGFSPSLTADLNTIVFAGRGNSGPGYDLYSATRSKPEEKFSTPSRITSCESAETEAYCSISPDGLLVAFLRTDVYWTLMIASRPTRDAEFGMPQVVTMENFNLDPQEQIISAPSLLSDERLVFGCRPRDGDLTAAKIYVAERDKEHEFFEPDEVDFKDASPLYTISHNRKRAYFGWLEGVSLSVRVGTDLPFPAPRVLVSAVVTGPVDGPLWVAPKEDMFFFCSPGAGQEYGDRKLWMVRY